MSARKFTLTPRCGVRIEGTRAELLDLAERLDRGVGTVGPTTGLIYLNLGGWILTFTPEDYLAFRNEVESYLVVGGEHL